MVCSGSEASDARFFDMCHKSAVAEEEEEGEDDMHVE